MEEKQIKRGVFLWIMLANFIFIAFQRLISLLFAATFSYIYAGGPNWGYGFNLAAFAVEVVSIVGILFWRKWGIYSMITIIVAEIAVDQIYFTPRISIVLGPVFSLSIIGLLVWAAKRNGLIFDSTFDPLDINRPESPEPTKVLFQA